MAKKLIVGAVVVYTLALAILIPVLIAAAPGRDSQAMLGVRIGEGSQPGGIAWLSGNRLSCENSAREPLASTCSIEIAGQALIISARRSLTVTETPCTASYGGRTWPCRLGWGKTVSANWFVLLDEPLGLNVDQMDALRMRYPVENLGETPFLIAALLLPTLNVLAFLALAWQLMPSGLRKNIPIWVANSGASVAIWFASVFFWLRLTTGFWD